MKFHRIPADKERRERWIAAIKRASVRETSEGSVIVVKDKRWDPSNTNYVCSAHFIEGEVTLNLFICAL